MRVYLDTNVIMDFFLDRRSSSYELIKKTISCFHEIIISDVVLEELKFQKVNCDTLLKLLDSAGKIDIAKTTIQDKIEARTILNPYNDTLHYLLAKRSNAECLVTSNIKDFKIFRDLPIKRPDDL